MTVKDYLGLVKFSHSVFALPFALMGAWLASRGLPDLRVLGLVVVAAVAARTAAMGFNRLVDRHIDARNPRTEAREIPSGKITPARATVLVLVASLVFLLAAWGLNPICALAAPFVLLVLLGYSFAKRFTALVHFWLGLALGLAPPAAWLAVRGNFQGDLWVPICLGLSVLFWVAGFDLIYACQDASFDRSRGLHSIPARLGVARSLWLARGLHLVTIALLCVVAQRADLGWLFGVSLIVAAALLVWEHSIVSADDLSRVNMAFFTLNGWVGIWLFVGTALDLQFLSHG